MSTSTHDSVSHVDDMKSDPQENISAMLVTELVEISEKKKSKDIAVKVDSASLCEILPQLYTEFTGFLKDAAEVCWITGMGVARVDWCTTGTAG